MITSSNKNGPVLLVSRQISYAFPMSYAYLAGYLLEKKEKVEILYRPKYDIYLPDLVKKIMNLKPLLVGFGNLYPELPQIRKIIQLLDQAGRTFPVVIGGQMVSPVPQFAVRIAGADFGVIGEGEITLYKLAQALRQNTNVADIGGMAVREGDEVHLTGEGEFIENMHDLPKIPYDLFPSKEWLNIGKWYAEHLPQYHWYYKDRVIDIHGGRGCPFKCNFCYHHSKARYRPIEDMMVEGREAMERFGGNMLHFSDDLVIASPDRARKLVEGIRGLGRKIEYSATNRVDILKRLDLELLKEMKSTGCRYMGIGIESGSDRILKMIGKLATNQDTLEGLEKLTRVGITPTVAIMVGQHTETKEDVEMSISLVKEAVRMNPNINFAFSITTPFPGSPLYAYILEKGLIADDEDFYNKYFTAGKSANEWKQVVNLSDMSEKEVFEMYARINRIYREEKRRNLPTAVHYISRSQVLLGRMNMAMSKVRKIFPGLVGRSYDSVYDRAQLSLEGRRNKLCSRCIDKR